MANLNLRFSVAGAILELDEGKHLKHMLTSHGSPSMFLCILLIQGFEEHTTTMSTKKSWCQLWRGFPLPLPGNPVSSTEENQFLLSFKAPLKIISHSVSESFPGLWISSV